MSSCDRRRRRSRSVRRSVHGRAVRPLAVPRAVRGGVRRRSLPHHGRLSHVRLIRGRLSGNRVSRHQWTVLIALLLSRFLNDGRAAAGENVLLLLNVLLRRR